MCRNGLLIASLLVLVPSPSLATDKASDLQNAIDASSWEYKVLSVQCSADRKIDTTIEFSTCMMEKARSLLSTTLPPDTVAYPKKGDGLDRAITAVNDYLGEVCGGTKGRATPDQLMCVASEMAIYAALVGPNGYDENDDTSPNIRVRKARDQYSFFAKRTKDRGLEWSERIHALPLTQVINAIAHAKDTCQLQRGPRSACVEIHRLGHERSLGRLPKKFLDYRETICNSWSRRSWSDEVRVSERRSDDLCFFAMNTLYEIRLRAKSTFIFLPKGVR